MDAIINQTLIASLIIGFILDSIIGDPLWLPHPIRLFGNIISKAEKKLNKNKHRKIKGAIVAVSLISLTWLILFLIFKYIEAYKIPLIIATSIGVFYGIANHSLIKEAWRVEKAMQNESIETARIKLSYIVGRETKQLNKQQIRTAILETLAENLSDGIIAPLLYFAIGGVPLMLAYKMINTLDSMIGYKNERYKQFGWFAAKTDDIFNFIPARITALIMVFITLSYRGILFIFKYANNHSSPNAGYPEAALSGILNLQFGGSNYYHGKMVQKPFIGNNNRSVTHIDIIKACLINAATSIIMLSAIIIIYHYAAVLV